jgi:hypothetical protein
MLVSNGTGGKMKLVGRLQGQKVDIDFSSILEAMFSPAGQGRPAFA